MSSPQGSGPKQPVSSTVIVAGVVVLVAIALAAIVVVLSVDSRDSGLVVGMVSAMVIPTITALLAAIKADQAAGIGIQASNQADANWHAINDVTHVINGKLDKVVNQALANPQMPPTAPGDGGHNI